MLLINMYVINYCLFLYYLFFLFLQRYKKDESVIGIKIKNISPYNLFLHLSELPQIAKLLFFI